MSHFRLLASVLILVVVSAARADPLLLCGGDEVFLVETGEIEKGAIKKVWSWRGKDCAELPDNDGHDLRASWQNIGGRNAHSRLAPEG